ncbi:MAG: hypothetical protein ACXADY_15050 [Candidatus Hodarchaeales archaeon]|jgi:endogenous inhibitor of DNA gyrase (YacG/DUF329 family)
MSREKLNFTEKKCCVCEKIVEPDSTFLNFCSEACEEKYTPSILEPIQVYQIYKKRKGRRVYTIEMNNNKLMKTVSEKNILKIYDLRGLERGEINWRKGEYSILGQSEEFKARVRILPTAGEKDDEGYPIVQPTVEIETFQGTFFARFLSDYSEGYILDWDGERYFDIIWEDQNQSHDIYKLDVFAVLSSFLLFAISVCLIERFIRQKRKKND